MKKSLPLLGLGIISSAISFAQIMYPGDVTTGTEEVVFDYSADACTSENSMDGSANALRDVDGNIQLYVPNHSQFRITGPDFDNLAPDCANGAIFSSDEDSIQGNHNYKEWMSAPYTTDGKTMYGLVHNEYHGYDFTGQCGHADVLKCWYNSITLVSSSDTGKTYSHTAAPSHLVASIPYQYDKDHGYRQGAFNPTNIIKHRTNGYYYAFFHTEAIGQQEDGTVVMRTNDLTDPASWRIYNGTDFSTESINPYTETGFDTTQHIFHTIAGHKMIGGVYYSTYFEKYIMIFHSGYESGGTMREGICYALSDDLITWGAKKLMFLLNPIVNSSTNASGVDYGGYPSLIDHNDTTRNFEEIGQTAYVYYTKWNNTANAGDPNRDLIRVPVTFSKNMVSGFTVTGTGNQEDTNPGDGVCETPAGNCSFYAAIQESNGRLAVHSDTVLTVDFSMGSRTINATAGAGTIPNSSYPLYINGTTNQSATENTADMENPIDAYIGVRIRLDGQPGLSFTGGNTTIKGLCISNPQAAAIGFSEKGNNTVTGCFLGTSIAGDANQSEAYDGWGVYIDNVPNITIGGTNASDRNLILGGIKIKGTSASNIVVKGNFIGTDYTGNVDLEESEHGISVSDSAQGVIIGGTTLAERNIISGNNRGIDVQAGSDQIQIINNYIGLGANGSSQVGNNSAGISLASSGSILSGNFIGNNGAGEAGIWLSGNFNFIQSNTIGSDASLTQNHPEGNGIILFDGAEGNLIGGYTDGKGNTITNSTGDGIATFNTAGTGNSFLGNSIYNNSEFGVDIYADNQTLEDDVPIITLASVDGDSLFVSGHYEGTPNSAFRIEFFSNTSCDGNGFGEGKTYLGYTTGTSDGSGILTFGDNIYAPAANTGDAITCLTTDGNGTTHEFSECFTASSGIPDIRLETTSVTFDVIAGENGDETVIIFNDGDADLTWSSTDSQDWHSAGTENGTINGASSTDVILNVFTSGLSTGTYKDTLVITSNDPDETVTQIEIILNVVAPNAEGHTDTVFYEMQPNRTEEIKVYLLNTGSGTLTFTAGMGLGAKITAGVNPNSGSVEPGDSAQIKVTMNSNGDAPGTYNDLVWFSTNDPDGPVVEIHIQTLVDLNVGIEGSILENDITIQTLHKSVNIISTSNFENIEKIKVIDALGRVVQEFGNLQESNNVLIKIANTGVYYLQFQTGSKTYTQKTIIK